MTFYDWDITCTSPGSREWRPASNLFLFLSHLKVSQGTDGIDCPSSGTDMRERATEPGWEWASSPCQRFQEFQYFSYLPPGMKGPFKTWMKISKTKWRWGQTKYFTLIMFKEYILTVTFLSCCLFLVQKEHGGFACFVQLENKTFHFKNVKTAILDHWKVLMNFL